MKASLFLICIYFVAGFGLNSNLWQAEPARQDRTYTGLTFERSLVLPALSGVKSVLFNTKGTKLYALNLEGMSIYEFDREKKKILRKIKFKPTKAQGWDYALNKPMPSFAEKPVEACFSHQDRLLWVSLHNGGGIVPFILDSTLQDQTDSLTVPGKTVFLKDVEKQVTDTQYLPLIKTGAMPKVIARTGDSKFLLVSNWGSQSLSVLKINDTLPPFGQKIASIKLAGVPRGIAVDDQNEKSYIGIYGSDKITVIRHHKWKIEKNFTVPRNPRHLVLDTIGRLFVSFNALAQVACLDASSGKILFKASTHSEPRTIALSDNHKYLFVTCYAGHCIDVFKINKKNFKRIFSLKSEGKPVGIGLYEDHEKLEAWVCNYLPGDIKVFVFKKTYD